MPTAQQNERSALTLLALAGIKPNGSWRKAKRPLLRTVDIMNFMEANYNKKYAPNSRETIRRQTIHQFEQARLIDRNPDNPNRPTNSGNTVYAVTEEFLVVLRSYGTPSFGTKRKQFLEQYPSLAAMYEKKRKNKLVPVCLPNGTEIGLSVGKHNTLQAAVVEQFAPRFAAGASLVLLGDTAKKNAFIDTELLAELKIPINEHDKMPDVMFYDKARHWLFLVEAVTSHGPVTPKRYQEIELLLKMCDAHRVYVTAFLNKADFRKYSVDIAWETEVWIADSPSHMIHFDGNKFLGPYSTQN